MININKQEFLDYLKYQKHYSNYTITNYELDITKYEQFIKINDVNYQDITYQEITNYMTYLKKIGLGSSSISRNLSALRSLYSYFLKNKIVKSNPFKLVSGIKKEKKLPNFLQYNEFEDILKNCGDDDLGIRNRALLELLIASGLRVGEIVSVKTEKIDFKERMIKVIGKGNKERNIYFGEYALDSLNKYLDGPRDRILNKKNNDFLFINYLGDELTTRGVADIIDRILEKTALDKKVSPHTFRHSFATMLINEGANTKVVQELMGHSSIGTTSIYTHLSNDKLRSEYLKTHPRARK